MAVPVTQLSLKIYKPRAFNHREEKTKIVHPDLKRLLHCLQSNSAYFFFLAPPHFFLAPFQLSQRRCPSYLGPKLTEFRKYYLTNTVCTMEWLDENQRARIATQNCNMEMPFSLPFCSLHRLFGSIIFMGSGVNEFKGTLFS